MRSRINIPPSEIDMYRTAADGMREVPAVVRDVLKIVRMVCLTQRLQDRIGVDIEKADSLEDILRLIVQNHDSAVVCVFDYLPEGDEEAVRRQSKDLLI